MVKITANQTIQIFPFDDFIMSRECSVSGHSKSNRHSSLRMVWFQWEHNHQLCAFVCSYRYHKQYSTIITINLLRNIRNIAVGHAHVKMNYYPVILTHNDE